MNVGVRELRNNLSRHLAEVRAGHTVTVTDHGRPVARIVPVDRPTKYEQLVAAGVIKPARRAKRPARPPIVTGTTVSDLLYEVRSEGW